MEGCRAAHLIAEFGRSRMLVWVIDADGKIGRYFRKHGMMADHWSCTVLGVKNYVIIKLIAKCILHRVDLVALNKP